MNIQKPAPDVAETRLPLSQQPGFFALPSDPDVPLTEEQLAALFPNVGALAQIVALGMDDHAQDTLG